MNFKSALEMMKNGHRMKRPSWGGFWVWDETRDTIMMHCRPNTVDPFPFGGDVALLNVEADDTIVLPHVAIDIRGTQRVCYTLDNIMANDWIEATKANCTLLGGIPCFDYDTAKKYAARGIRVIRFNNQAITLEKEDLDATDWTFYDEINPPPAVDMPYTEAPDYKEPDANE